MILITGASKGIGNDICLRLIQNGHKVVGLSRDVSNLNFESYSCDVSSYSELNAVAKKIKQKHKSLSALINVAGIASMNLALLTPPKITKDLIQTNLIGTIFCSQLFAPLIIKNNGGSIINFSTIAVPIGIKGESVYVASKAGVEGFSKSFAREMADFNITVNCISPGPLKTNLTKNVNPNLIKNLISKQIISKQLEIKHISDLVEIILDKKFNTVTGQVITPGGI
ncbi:MAG: 3-oxoacyl-ACP reductase [Candidatus Endolissoclinum sp. TMED37]|nr:MAG: 3-oxoacyl-ACP reductase [Candidatus Endolissoclinum sp. TMED37]